MSRCTLFDYSHNRTATDISCTLYKKIICKYVPAEVVAKEKEIMLVQMAGDPKTANKPEAVKQKMIEGKIKKFFKENCLVDQEFVKDSDLTVAQYTAKVAKDLGGDIKIVKFARFQKGEGLEKRADDFAAEVASMVK